MHAPVIAYRRLTPADDRFVAAVYASSREDELTAAGLTGPAKAAFLRQQFEAQTLDWGRNFPRAGREMILVDREPAGRLLVDRDAAARRLHIIDITLLARFRGVGVGTKVLARLLEEADERGWDVTLQAEVAGRAQRLYLRLGFAPVRRNGFRVVMQRTPRAGANVAAVFSVEPSTQA